MYLGSHQGRLLAIDLSKQKLVWFFETDAAKKNGPAQTNDKGAPKYEAAFADNFYDDIVVGLQRCSPSAQYSRHPQSQAM